MPIDELMRERFARLDGFTHQDVNPLKPELEAAFKRFAEPVGGDRMPVVVVADRVISGPHGEIPIRVYAPRSRSNPGPGLVWLHGGAFAGGDLDMPEADYAARELCLRADATVVSVDYRPARGGVSFPVPHDDVVAAFRWAVAAGDELQIEPGRVGLGGGSAGANLAAGAALRLRDEGDALPSGLLLCYPALHFELPAWDETPVEMAYLPEVFRFSAAQVSAINKSYLGDAELSPYAFPALGDSAGLPRTVIVTSEFDDLRPSAETFTEQLCAAGVDVAMRCEPGVVHAHLNIPGLPANGLTLSFLADALKSSREVA